MCLKHVGAEIPLMKGTRPRVWMRVAYDHVPLCTLTLKRAHLPSPCALPEEFRNVLDMDKRKPGEHRPLRLVRGLVDRDPYSFYCARLPGEGLHLPHGTLAGHLELELWIDSPQPLWHYAVHFHLKGSDPVVHPFGKRVLWVGHKQWTGAWTLGGRIISRDGTPCGCCMRTRLRFEEFTPMVGCNG